MRFLPIFLLLAACDSAAEQKQDEEPVELPVPSGPPIVEQEDVPDTSLDGAPRWESATGAGGTALRLVGEGGRLEMSMSCASAPKRLIVSVPHFSPIGSEDRFSLALGQEPVTLVADPTRQPQPGVTAEGAVPDNFAQLLERADRIGALYGTQRSGPHPAPPEPLRKALAEECDG